VITSGRYSYAEIPKKFEAVLGISGTVETTPIVQKQAIYVDYDIKYETIVPSYFGSQKLNFSTIHNVHVTNQNDYHAKIRAEIDKNLSG